MMEEDLKERQDDEIQVLQSIYMGDFVDLRKKNAWKVKEAPRIKLTLVPLESTGPRHEVHAQLDMVIKCPKDYPNEVPEIEFKNTKGLSIKQLEELKADINEHAENLKGEVMILELAQRVQQFLLDHNKPPAKSFYDEMLSNQKRLEEQQADEIRKKQEQLKKREEKEKQLLEEEIRRRQAAIKEESRKRFKEEQEFASSDTKTSEEMLDVSPIGTPGSTPKKRGHSMSVSPSPQIVGPCKGDGNDIKPRRRRTSTPRRDSGGDSGDHLCREGIGGILVLTFDSKVPRSVQRGACIGHGGSGSTVYAGMDTGTGEMVAIAEWTFRWNSGKKRKSAQCREEDEKMAEKYMKQVTGMQQEMNTLIHHRHGNLVHYLGMKSNRDWGRITVHILMEFCSGFTLETSVRRGEPVSMNFVKWYAEEILCGLDYLHSKDVVHKHLKPSSVFLDSNGIIRLADYSLHRRLAELYHDVESSRPGVHFDDIKPPPIIKCGKKGDILQLGTLLLSIAQGVQYEGSSPPPDIPTVFIDVFHDFLNKCLIQDDRHRWSVQQLMDHSFIKEALPITIALPHVKSTEEPKSDKDKNEDSAEEEENEAPFITALEASGHSRLTHEFEILKSLGKGGFGDVIKVKNKLDDRLYAIKRIPLNPKSKVFNKKITREVKLLSRLNHENVVRYYNSWIETSEDPAETESSTATSSTSPTDTNDKPKVPATAPVGLYQNLMYNNNMDDIENQVPSAETSSSDWNLTGFVGQGKGLQPSLDDSDEDSSDDEDDEDDDDSDSDVHEIMDVFGTMLLEEEESGFDVVFETSAAEQYDLSALSAVSMKADNKTDEIKVEDVSSIRLQYLYIQMEYCEKSTLRNCIDAGLNLDVDRAWRLFREICEGLQHIHEQGMIHRDLKPVNIFLDSNDHVKIGDFGLATSNIINVKSSTLYDVSMTTATNFMDSLGSMSSRSNSLGDGNLTGKVGTALYVAPEMMTGESKIIYSQKVDIYSLGVIFFEMCYKPLPTGMERVKILGNLRHPDILLPEDFDQLELKKQTNILKWLLDHDPSKRPTAKELLQSSHLPPPQLEEAELNEVLRSTISSTNSKAYRKMISELLNQEVSPVEEMLYDNDSCECPQERVLLIQEHVRENLQKLFTRHGAVRFGTSLMMPRCPLYQDTDQYSCLMDHNGHPIGLPYDLRVPFARHVSRCGVQSLKRYYMDRVFQVKKFIQHPIELMECLFDVVTSSQSSLIPDAELMLLAQDVVRSFPELQARNYYIKINHMAIVKALLLNCDIPDDLHPKVRRLLSGAKAKINHQNKVLHKHLIDLGLKEGSVNKLISKMVVEGPMNQVASEFSQLMSSRGLASSLAKKGIHEIETVIMHAVSMGLEFNVIFSPGFVYNTYMYSGIVFQVLYDKKSKNVSVPNPIATGGRYDDLVKHFAPPMSSHSSASAAGVSFGFDKIVQALKENKQFQPPSPYDVLVCNVGQVTFSAKATLKAVGELWGAGLRANLLMDSPKSIDELQKYCNAVGIQCLVIINSNDCAMVKSLKKDKMTKVNLSELLKHVQTVVSSNPQQTHQECQQPGTNTSLSNVSKSSRYSQQQTFSDNQLQGQNTGSSNMAKSFCYFTEKNIAASAKKKQEYQLHFKINNVLSNEQKKLQEFLDQRKAIECIYTDLNSAELKVIAAFLELNSGESCFRNSVSSVITKLPKYKKILPDLTDHIFKLKFEQHCSLMVLYGSKDDSFQLLS